MAVYQTPRNRMVAGAARAPRVPAPTPRETTPQPEPTPRTPFSDVWRGAAVSQYGTVPTTAEESGTAETDLAAGREAGKLAKFINNWNDTGTNTAAQQRAQARREIKSIRDYLQSGGYRQGMTGLLGAIEAQKASELAAAQSRFGTAKENVGTAYGALRTYLEQNAPTAYANVPQAAAAPIENALAQYMTAQQAPTTRAEAAVNLANMLGDRTAANYNQLLNVLRAAETTGQTSRLSETEMGRTSAERQLAAALAARQAQIESETAAARVAAEKSAYERQQQLLDRILGLRRY